MKGRVALVTGATRGIGLAIAHHFRMAGATVLTPTRAELDLLSNQSIDAYVESLKRPVDILVNNAGINNLAGTLELSDSNLNDTLQVNLVAPTRLIRGLAPGMTERRYGRIVNVSSVFSVVSKPRRVAYSISKSGLNSLTRSVAVELAPCNVLVNAVAPGFVNTELTRQNNTAEQIDAIRQTIPVQRLAEPEEIAQVVAFLCSERNSYVTGQTILVDGGFASQ